MTFFGTWASEVQNTPRKIRAKLLLIVIIAIIVLISLFRVRSDLTVLQSTWAKKRQDIANVIRTLGAGYRQV